MRTEKNLLEQIMTEFPDHAPRSKLEPYLDLIRELRRKRYPYREIAQILEDKFKIKVSYNNVYTYWKRHQAEARKQAQQEAKEKKEALDQEEGRKNIEKVKAKQTSSQQEEKKPFSFDANNETLKLNTEPKRK